MIYISKFQDFNNDFINEAMIYYSPDFRERVETVFNDYSSDIAGQILDLEATDIKVDYTLIDSKQDSDDITFITNKNANKLLKKAGYDDLESGDKELIDKIWFIDKQYKYIGITTQSRNNMKIGKFVKKLFGNKFTDKQIEEFVNQFKSKKESKLEFKLVSGEEISKWYHPMSVKYHKGTLGNSCMNSRDKNYFFKLYTENPEVCQLLILLENNKLVGRALVWKINKVEAFRWDYDKSEHLKDKKLNLELSKFKYFMDRVYTTDDYLENNFINLAKKRGWLYKWNNNSHNPEYVEMNNERIYVKMSVKVKKLDYSPYPYLDTFKRYNHFNGTLNNDEIRKLGGHILTSTQGDIYSKSISRGRYYINRFKDLI